MRDKGVTVAMLTLHVDDGVLAGARTNKVYREALKGINSKFNIKEWNDLKRGGAADSLGAQWKQDDEGVTLDMDTHIEGITEMEAMKAKHAGSPQALSDLKLDADGVHAFRSVLAKLPWPVSHVVPELWPRSAPML